MTPDTPLQLYNSVSRRLELFCPSGPLISIFSCGPLLFDPPHLGVLRGAVGVDALKRAFRWKGFQSKHVFMLTDIAKDKGAAGGWRRGRRPALAAVEPDGIERRCGSSFDAFQRDTAALHLMAADHYPRPSRNIPLLIDLARSLEQQGYAYRLPSGLYFDVARAPGYGSMAKMEPERQRPGRHFAGVRGRRNAADFALWRVLESATEIGGWSSPWGWGIPGGHLACSAISMDLLGPHFDIHTGGKHHRQLHHVNEIAQSEALLDDGRQWVRYWLHHDLLNFQHRPLVRGSAPYLSDVTARGVHPSASKLFLLGGHYRKRQALSTTATNAAQVALQRLVARLGRCGVARDISTYEQAAAAVPSSDTTALKLLSRLDAAMSTDLNTPQAVAVLHEITRTPSLQDTSRHTLAGAADSLLGLGLASLVQSAR